MEIVINLIFCIAPIASFWSILGLGVERERWKIAARLILRRLDFLGEMEQRTDVQRCFVSDHSIYFSLRLNKLMKPIRLLLLTVLGISFLVAPLKAQFVYVLAIDRDAGFDRIWAYSMDATGALVMLSSSPYTVGFSFSG